MVVSASELWYDHIQLELMNIPSVLVQDFNDFFVSLCIIFHRFFSELIDFLQMILHTLVTYVQNCWIFYWSLCLRFETKLLKVQLSFHVMPGVYAKKTLNAYLSRQCFSIKTNANWIFATLKVMMNLLVHLTLIILKKSNIILQSLSSLYIQQLVLSLSNCSIDLVI